MGWTGKSLPVACSRVLGNRRPDGWTSPARTLSSKPQLQARFLDCVSRPRKGFKSASPSRNPLLYQSHLVLSWFGRTLVCSLPAGFTVDELECCVSEYTAVPRSSFFLTFQGKMIAADQVKNIDSGSPFPVVMHGRLRGVLQFRELGCAMFVMLQGAGPRKVDVSGVGMPEIHVFLLMRLVPRSRWLRKSPSWKGSSSQSCPCESHVSASACHSSEKVFFTGCCYNASCVSANTGFA